MYATHAEPAWEPFVARFGRYIQSCPMELEDLTASSLRATLVKQSAKAACGMDGWRVAEL